MKVGFDIDGVIVPINLAIIRLLDYIGPSIGKEAVANIWKFYVGDRKIQLNPLDFLSEDDELFIITGRDTIHEEATVKWAKKYFPQAEVIVVYNDSTEELSAKEVEEKWYVKAAKKKARILNHLKIDVYFEDTAPVVRELRKMCPDTKIIQYGGRFGL